MSFILYLLITALVIGFLTFIHEFGHFFFARLFGVPVTEFAIGMGPKIYSWKGKKGTNYALRAFPIGGFVQMVGEEGTSDDPNGYDHLSPWKKIAVTSAGPIVNIIFAILLMFILVLSTPTLPSTTLGVFTDPVELTIYNHEKFQSNDEIVKVGGVEVYSVDDAIYEVEKQGYQGIDVEVVRDGKRVLIEDVDFIIPVSNAKLQKNDKIVKVGNVNVHTVNEIAYEIGMQGYQAIDIEVVRNGKRILIEDVVFNTLNESGAVLGIMDFKVYRLSDLENITLWTYLEQAVYRSLNMVKMVFDSLWGMISGRFGMDAVSGPVGIVGVVGEVASVSIGALVNLIVMISMNLGIFNLLPIPALDGGRIVFHLIDGIAGKKVINKKVEDTIVSVTMMILLGFMLLITVKDVINLF